MSLLIPTTLWTSLVGLEFRDIDPNWILRKVRISLLFSVLPEKASHKASLWSNVGTFQEGTTQGDVFFWKTRRAWPKSLICKLRSWSIEWLLSCASRLKSQTFIHTLRREDLFVPSLIFNRNVSYNTQRKTIKTWWKAIWKHRNIANPKKNKGKPMKN